MGLSALAVQGQTCTVCASRAIHGFVCFVVCAAGHPHSYSYCALVCGVLWPEDVDPQAREDHLSPDEFKQVFEMDFEQYSGLPAWKKRVLKQERRLF